MEITALVSRWLHILPATVLVGALFTLWLMPSGNQDEDSNDVETFKASLRKNWSKMVMICAFFLIVTGFYSIVQKSQAFDLPSYYHPLIGIKILLALAIFWIMSTLTGRSESAEKMRQNEKKLLNFGVLCAVILIVLAGTMKSADVKKKSTEELTDQSTVETFLDTQEEHHG